MATLQAGPPDGRCRISADQPALRRSRRSILAAVAFLVVLAGLFAVSSPASAAGEDLSIPEDHRNVIQGDSVPINVTFGAGESEERVTVECPDGCPTWERTVVFDEEKANCEITDAFVGSEGSQTSRRVCQISFPDGFQPEGGGSPPAQQGEPSRASTYEVRMGIDGQQAYAEFDTHLSSASTCRPLSDGGLTGVGQRSDIVLLSTSGHPEGEQVTLKVQDGQRVFFERTFTSAGEQIAYHFRWEIPLDLPIQGSQRTAEIIVDAASRGEREEISLEPGVAQAIPVREPGRFGQQEAFNRTESVQVWTAFQFFAAPQDCKDMAWDRNLQPVTGDHVGEDPPNVLVRRHNDPPTSSPVETVDTTESSFRTTDNLFLVDYTIPKNEEATDEDDEDPLYDIRFERTQLDDGNYIGTFNSSDYEVHPYTIEPAFELLQDEVERLETAQLVLNLTYADGSPFTPDDASDDLEIAFGLEGEDPQFTFEANHRGDGIWNVSEDLGFEYEPLGSYTWRISELTDTNGPPGEENRVGDTVTDIVDVLSARPRLDLTTIVDDEQVDDAQRTQRVNVRMEAHYQNGVPVTDEEIDPSLGGIQLDVDKRNEFGRVVDQDQHVLTHVSDGAWVGSFRIGRAPSAAPVGLWDLTFEVRDDREPPNENLTSFPFRVHPANLTVAATESPPSLVDGDEVAFQFRAHYPDGTLVSERLLDETRGGGLDVTLERVSPVDEPAIVEEELEPRPISGGQAWRVQMNASTIVPGNHFFNVTGTDVHGNPIPAQPSDLFTVLFNGEFRNSTTPICPESNLTSGCDIDRGEDVYVVFPGASGDEGMFGERPEIRVHRQDPDSGRWVLFREDVWMSSQQFFNQTGRDIGNNHVGRFVTDRSTPTDAYRLVVLGRGSDDQGFAGFSQPFNVTRIPVERDVIQPLPAQAQKTEEIAARIESQPGDVIDTTIVEGGPVRARNVQTDTIGVGTFVRWQPPSSFPTGPISIQLEGRDLFGNPFQVDLGPVQLQPVEIEVQQDGSIGDLAPRGERFSFDLQMTYETGAPFSSGDGDPEVVVRDLQGNEVDSGDAIERGDNWEIRWQPRADLPSGDYEVTVTGTDSAGNVVNDFTTPPIGVAPGTVTGSVGTEPPSTVQRGERVEASFTFPTNVADGEATATTGADPIGDPQTTIDGSTVRLSFPTDRSTELVDARFRFTGTDTVGNNITAETDRFTVQPQQLDVQWIDQPPTEATNDEPVEAAFVVEYPDGTPLRAGEGVPIVGLFAGQQPLGQVEASPLEENPAVWQVRWEPPGDVRTDIPYHFSADARDTFNNEATPVASQGFFVQDPIVPEYVPVDGPGPAPILLALAGLALLLHRRSQD